MKRFYISRRKFLYTATAVAAGAAIPFDLGAAARKLSANDKLNIGIIGAGGRGWDNLQGVKSENIVALCDVDDVRSAKARESYPQAKVYRDFRKMLADEKSIDAVVVTTPDHTHATAAITAMRAGKHVYCEKPLTHTIYEARLMRKVAAETGVVTQMGQQGHSMEGTRQAVEVIRSGALGDVKELHVWTDRPAGWWPQGMLKPTGTQPVPDTLDWDLWLGPAQKRPFHSAYLPFVWRGFWDFGTGSMGDMGVHNLNTAFWALDLGLPSTAELKASGERTEDSPPLWSNIELNFPARNGHGPIKMNWYDGKKYPPADLFHGEKIEENGSLIIGSKGTLYTRTWHGGGEREGDMFKLLPVKDFEGFKQPAKSLPRTPNHHQEWISACKGGPKTESHFAYASVLTELLLVANLASRTGKKIEWDAENMKARGVAEADQYIKPEFRSGWNLEG